MRDSGLRRHRLAEPAVYGRVHSIERITKVARGQVVPGAVVRASVVFLDGPGDKYRPVVVVSVGRDGVTVRPCTSSDSRQRSAGTVELEHLSEAGLFRATGVLSRLLTLSFTDLITLLGTLSTVDAERVLGAPLPAIQAAA